MTKQPNWPFLNVLLQPEPVFVNVYGAQESIPPGWNRFLGSLKGLQIRALATLMIFSRITNIKKKNITIFYI
jgi:hypothetical protein